MLEQTEMPVILNLSKITDHKYKEAMRSCYYSLKMDYLQQSRNKVAVDRVNIFT